MKGESLFRMHAEFVLLCLIEFVLKQIILYKGVFLSKLII